MTTIDYTQRPRDYGRAGIWMIDIPADVLSRTEVIMNAGYSRALSLAVAFKLNNDEVAPVLSLAQRYGHLTIAYWMFKRGGSK